MLSRSLTASLLVATLLISACAHNTRATDLNGNQDTLQPSFVEASWSGRISLQVQGDTPQAFFASFELKGSANSGELALISPLGNILALMRWTPTGATLEQGGTLQRFSSTDELLAQATGASVRISALFDWLEGKNTDASGWLADLSQLGNGRITAKRISPTPQADLQIVLDK